MADNILLNAGSGGATLATDDDGTAQHQYVKVEFGADNTQTPVSSANPLPVDLGTNNDVTVTSGAITETNSTAILADTASMDTNLATIAGDTTSLDGKDFSTETTLSAMNAKFVSGTDIGDVDVLSVIPGVGASNLGKAEDSVHTSGDVGVMGLVVRKDNLAASGADGDYVPVLTDKFGAAWVTEEPNEVDSNNSTTSTLGSGATFTGTSTNVLGYSAVTVNVDSNVDSATDGLQLQLSSDGTNWDIDRPFNYSASNNGTIYQLSTSAQFFRVVYTNGGSGQATFRLQTILHHTTPIGGTHRLVDDEDPDSFTVLVKAAIVAQAAGSGDFKPVQATNGGNLKVSLEESNGDLTGPGTEDTALKVTMATDSTGLLSIDDNGGSLTVDNTGTFATQATLQANSGVDIGDVDVLSSALPAGAATSANQIAKATGGHSFYLNQDTNAVASVKSSAGTLYWLSIQSIDATPVYLNLYNVASGSVTLGTTTPDMQFIVPSQGDANGAGLTIHFGDIGIQFDTAITVACATTFGGSVDPGANVVITNIGFE